MDCADLHLHSVHSDGRLTVKEIVEESLKLNLKAISITDHDTITSTVEALKYKDRLDIVEGIELSTIYKGNEIHILGYSYDLNNEELNSLVVKLQESRFKRAEKMVEKFNSIGINITTDDLERESSGKSIGRPHFARLLLKKGYVDSVNEAFDKYISNGRPCYVEKYKLPTSEAIEVIRRAGGIPVLAHPGLIRDQQIIMEIVNLGVMGIEVYHSKHTPLQERDYFEFARLNKLLITGGSDCHSKSKHDNPFIGNVSIPYSFVEELKKHKL